MAQMIAVLGALVALLAWGLTVAWSSASVAERRARMLENILAMKRRSTKALFDLLGM